VSVLNLCRKHGLSSLTFYKRKAKYGGLDVSEARHLKGLEDENAKLKPMLADAMLDNVALKDLLEKNGDARRPSRGCGVSTVDLRDESAWACRGIGTNRTSMRYRATRPDKGALREQLRALAEEQRRFGYCRLCLLLRQEGAVVNRKRVQRIYKEERLTVRRRRGRKRAVGTDRPIETSLGLTPLK